MKPSLFEYRAPDTLEEAMEILAEDEDAMILAGGQSLIPAMNFRLANPPVLVDLRKIEGLSDIKVEQDVIHVGPMVRHRDLELSEDAFEVNGLIRKAQRHVAHVPIRNRGTVVGSLCHADAAAEMPLVLVVCDGWVTARNKAGERRIDAKDFFQFHMTTSRNHDEIIVGASIPALPRGAGYVFEEYARRRGDYALAAVAAVIALNGGAISHAAVGACGVAARPVRLSEVEEALLGKDPANLDIADIAELSREYVTVPDDIHATSAYRRHLLSGLVSRALTGAMTAASRGSS